MYLYPNIEMDNHRLRLRPLKIKFDKFKLFYVWIQYITWGLVLYVRVKSPDNGLNRTPPDWITEAVTVVPDGVTAPALVIEILGLSPPLAIHSILYL